MQGNAELLVSSLFHFKCINLQHVKSGGNLATEKNLLSTEN